MLDLGSATVFDAYLASKEFGEYRHVIGANMLIEMIKRSRENLMSYKNIELRFGEI